MDEQAAMVGQAYGGETAVAARGSRRDRRWRLGRWVPTVAAVGVVLAAGVGFPAMAGAAVDLPDRTPQQVLAMLAGSEVTAFSGTIEQTSDLGLPSLPMAIAEGGEGAATALELLTAPHTAQVFAAPGQLRVQVLDMMSERDLVLSGSDLWIYDAGSKTAWHKSVKATEKSDVPAELATTTPAALAEQALAAITPTTDVSVGRDGRVAGRTAYELILTPRSDQTLVGSVVISVDSQTGMPLGVDVVAKGTSDPAIHVAFRDLRLGAPDPAVFQFTPPAGASVEQAPAEGSDAAGTTKQTGPEPQMVGTGWDAVLALSAGELMTSAPTAADASGLDLINQLTTSVPEGRAVSTSLLSALLTNDGRVLVGMVPVSRLQAVAQAQ